MAKDLTPSKNPLVSTLFSNVFGVESPTPQDKFSIDYASGLMTATVNRTNGIVEVVRRSVGHDCFTETTTFDASALTKNERNEIIYSLSDDRMSQSEIARRTGVSQATVSNVLRKRT